MRWDPERFGGKNRDIVLSRALIEGILKRNGGAVPTPNLGRMIRESLVEAAKELGIEDLERYLGINETHGYGKFTYNTHSRLFLSSHDNRGVLFDPREGKIFSHIFREAPRVVPYDTLYDALGENSTDEHVRVCVHRVRKKLQFFPDAAIENVTKVGYRFQDLSLTRR